MLAPRVLYGLHERFVLFPYVAGAKYTKLVLRASALDHLARETPRREVVQIGAPLVLGELYGRDVFRASELVPVTVSGKGLHSLYLYGSAEWHLRWYRMRGLLERSIRFEAGSKATYATHTQYFSLDLLRDLARQGGPTRETRTPDRLPEDRGPTAS